MGNVFLISFFKTLFDSTGHRADRCEGIVEVRAKIRKAAVENARHRFAVLKRLTNRPLRRF